ncbi:MAG: hypothetical protein MJ200_02425 [Mycoplasmoidaceae bacterium]|nr:hypothetical protein [Mycoplasmoidaceae bacterium]
MPDDKNLSIFIDGTNDVQFEDATRTKTIEINDQTDQNITLGFNSFEQAKGSQFNLKFSYLLSGYA